MMIGQLRIGPATLAYDSRSADSSAHRPVPFIFQHGMGGDTAQPLGYVGDRPPVPVISLSARGHAPSDDLTDPAVATFDTFADDVVALADHLGLSKFAIGGISLGAGTAVNLAVRYPHRVSAVVLCRPAWLDRPQAEFNQAAYREIADILDQGGDLDLAADRYRRSPTYLQVSAVSPAAAASLLGQLTRPRAAQNSLLLRAFPRSSPTPTAELWTQINLPTLVIGHRDDPFHPYEIAEAYAQAIPNAQFSTVPSKDADQDAFAYEIRSALHAFLMETAGRP
jgi:pimeloyl-ACP methyl ester carboxylesterase